MLLIIRSPSFTSLEPIPQFCNSGNTAIGARPIPSITPFCVSIGYHQKDELVDFEKLEQDGYDFVQRPTGGRAILHAEELTYSVIFPRNSIHHRQLYRFFHQIFADALKALDYPVELKSDNEKLGELTHRADDFP